MAPSPYLLSVTSRPTVVSDSLWQQWYTEEHLPDLVNSRTSTRATFYTEVTHQLNNAASYPRKFLALYQTDFAEPLKTENYTTLRTTSELFGKEGGKEGIQDNGDFNARNYELIQEFDPTKIGEVKVPSPYILTVEMHPQDASDFDEWYRKEHLDLLSKIPGYRRCLRYKLGPPTPAALSKGISDPAKGLVESGCIATVHITRLGS
ncbi:hypothetical protein H2198_006776 [Neophaeococcomyces mojaviensis]|uniref:Uncharacterized protein n=1 Tax=Neophaeococcomyces mojaviensis TaxID=3383035 RepID=A0ACC3A1X0_9EURO|nr:hypothetical protein H2198_006776 [Knufia sp. JES_112]